MWVYLGLGSNVGDRAANLRAALAHLSAHGQVVRASAVYESAAMYVTDQPSFLNMAILFESPMTDVAELLVLAKQIEAQMGRDLGPDAQRYGPRPLDIDLLFAADAPDPAWEDGIVSQSDVLALPHPRIAERAFVLLPLLEVAAPRLYRHVQRLLPLVQQQAITRLALLDALA